MIDVTKDKLISLPDVAQRYGKCLLTITNWTRRGVRGVQLEAASVGYARYTTDEALRQFSERLEANRAGHESCAGVAGSDRSPTNERSAIEAERASKAAGAELVAAGF